MAKRLRPLEKDLAEPLRAETFVVNVTVNIIVGHSETFMNGNLLASLGKIAGLGGISLGVFVLLFRGVLEKHFLPETGLTSPQAFAVILVLMILTFGIAGIGVIAWLVGQNYRPPDRLPGYALTIIAILLISVVGAAIYVGSQASAGTKNEDKQSTGPSPTTVVYRICTGEYENKCQAHDAYLYCDADISAWATSRCGSFTVQKINSYSGNKCGYGIFSVICRSPH